MTHAICAMSMLADFWLPGRGSTVAPDTDWLFNLIFWICIFFFLLITVLLAGFSWMYRHREGREEGDAPKHNTALELTWTLIPTVIVIFIFYYGFKGFLNIVVAPPNAYEIVVEAQTWNYSFVYSNGVVEPELTVPANTAVQMVLSSKDVIHGFYVPEFRVKKDIVPGRYNKLWFQSDQPGDYDLYCTQYCGQGHSTMRSRVHVVPPKEFDAWLKTELDRQNNLPPLQWGERIYHTRGCAGCHSIDGSKMTGPTWKNMWGNPVSFESGPDLAAVDEAYVKESIYYPAAKIVKGYPNVMPSFMGQLDERRDLQGLYAYMRSLSDKGGSPQAPTPATTVAPKAP